ncbi:MAG: sigma 54-interacting transcriptional regulator, partial [Nitrospiria bacterium]
RRRAAPFVSIDCGAMAKSVLESELFGVAKEYPGFHNRERLVGRLELAGEGVLLLDEIGNMEADLQVKLLRVLEEKEFQPFGEDHALPLAAQVVASTNVDLAAAIARGRFREDLFFRLNEIPVRLPPLRARLADVPLLVTHILDRHNRRMADDRRMTSDALDKLMNYRWPGNVRELNKTLERAFVLSERRFITDIDIQFAHPSAGEPAMDPSIAPPSILSSNLPLREAEEAFRQTYIEDVLRRVGGDKLKAAVLLGIDLRTIQRILARK